MTSKCGWRARLRGANSTPNPDYDGGKGYSPVGAVGDPETGQRCEGNSSCVPICPVQAKYNALKTLATIPTDRVEVKIQSRSVASQVLIDPDSGRVSGVVYKQYHDEKSPEYSTHTARAQNLRHRRECNRGRKAAAGFKRRE